MSIDQEKIDDIHKEIQCKTDFAKTEADRMFNLAEPIVMKYMSTYLDIDSKKLFKDTSALERESIPLILNPLDSMEKKQLKFSLDIVEYDYKLELPKVLEDSEEVNYTIGFIYHSIHTVFNSILKSNIRDEMMGLMVDTSFNLELDDVNLAFYPIYMHPPKRMQKMLLTMKSEIQNVLNTASKDNMNEGEVNSLQMQLSELDNHLSNIKYDESVAEDDEKKVNGTLKHKNRIGIIFTEIEV